MKALRAKTLWRVPVYCLLASLVCYELTVRLGGFFYIVRTQGADGIEELSADSLRSMLFQGVLFLAVLFFGGLLIFRSMTKLEIAVSAAIISAVHLVIILLQLFWSGFPLSLSMELARFQEWMGILASGLAQLTGLFELSAIAASFAPFLFVPFGKRSAV